MGEFHKLLSLGIIIVMVLVLVLQGKRKEGFYGQAYEWNPNTVWDNLMMSGDERGKYYYRTIILQSGSSVPVISGNIDIRLGYTDQRTEPHFRNRLAAINDNWQIDSFRGLSQNEEWRAAFMRLIKYTGEAKLARFQLAYDLAKTYKNRPTKFTQAQFDNRDNLALQSQWWTNFRNNNPHESLFQGTPMSWIWYPSSPNFYDPEIGNIDQQRPIGSSGFDYSFISNGDALGTMPDEYLDALMSKWKAYETYKVGSFYFDWDDEQMYFYDLTTKTLKKLDRTEANKGAAQQASTDVQVDDQTQNTGVIAPTSDEVNQGAESGGIAMGTRVAAATADASGRYMRDIMKRKTPFLKLKKRLIKFTVPKSPSPITLAIGLFIDSLLALADQALGDAFPNMKPCNPGEFDLKDIPKPLKDFLENVPGLGDVFGRVIPLFEPYLCIGRACPADKEMDSAGGLCYPRCRSGYTSNDITMCLSNCPSGYRTDPLTCFKAGSPILSRDTYDRGVGTPAVYFRWKERDLPAYQRMNQQRQQMTNDLKAIRYTPNYSEGTCVLSASDNTTIMKAARLLISLTNSTQWITKISKAIVSSSRSIDFQATMNNDSVRIMRFYFTKDSTGCSFTPTGLTLLKPGTMTWDFETYGGEEINMTLDYGLSQSCKTNNVGNSCSSSLVINAAVPELPKAMAAGQWITSVDEVKDVSDTTCLYKANVDTFNPDTNRPLGRVKKILQANVARDFDPATCKVAISTVSDLGLETAMAATDTRRTGYRTLTPASTMPARPPPTEKTLEGCSVKCSNPAVQSRLIYQYNKSTGPNSKIIRVKKASTPSPTACDFLMDMVIRDSQGNTKLVETNRRMNVRKVGTTCDFDYVSLDSSDTGWYIQDNTPETAERIGFTSAIQDFMKSTNDALTRYMDGVSTANQTSDTNVRAEITKQQEAQKEEASERALQSARTAGGMKTLSQCGLAINNATIVDLVKRMARVMCILDYGSDISRGEVTIEDPFFDKWGYDNTTNTVYIAYILNFYSISEGRGKRILNIAGFRFYSGLCNPPRIHKATQYSRNGGLQPGLWLAPGPAKSYFVTPLGEIRVSPASDTDRVSVNSNGSQINNFINPPIPATTAPASTAPSTLTIESAVWGDNYYQSDVTETVKNIVKNGATSIRLDSATLGIPQGWTTNRGFRKLEIDYMYGPNGTSIRKYKAGKEQDSVLLVSSLT